MKKYKVELPKEFVDFLKENGSVVDTGNGTYRFLPMWFKDTADDQVLEIEHLGKLSQDLINCIKFREMNFKDIKMWKPNLIQRFMYWTGLFKDPRYDGKKVDWRVFDEECHMNRRDIDARFECNKKSIKYLSRK